MRISTTSKRLKFIIEKYNLKQTDILEKCMPFSKKYGVKIQKNDLSQYISGKFSPRQDKLSLLADALNVSEVWLMGYDVPENFLESNSSENLSLSDNEKIIINHYRKLNKEGQEKLIDYADDLVSSKKYIQSDPLGLDKKVG